MTSVNSQSPRKTTTVAPKDQYLLYQTEEIKAQTHVKERKRTDLRHQSWRSWYSLSSPLLPLTIGTEQGHEFPLPRSKTL